MNTDLMMKLAIAAGVLYAAYRFAPSAVVKTAVVGVAGVIAAKQIPYVKDVM